MRNRKYEMVVSDFDGTLLRSDDTISEFTKERIARFVNQGGIFVLSSGRTTKSILSIARGLGLKGVASTFNGSVVVDIESGKPILERRLSIEDTFDICSALEEIGLYVQIYDLENFYAKESNPFLRRYETAVGSKAILTGKPVSEYVREKKLSSIKVLSMVDPALRDEYTSRLREKFGDKYYVTSGAPYLIEICSRGYSKGTAIKLLAEYYGVSLEKIIAIGDSLNDLPMLRSVGLGIAVKNAEGVLKKEALSYAYSNDEDAVGRIIEEFAMEK